MSSNTLSFQALILRLQDYWSRQGCVLLQPYDMEMGAGTFHPATTSRYYAATGRNCWPSISAAAGSAR